jgi:Winged helix DNA-binding domain
VPRDLLTLRQLNRATLARQLLLARSPAPLLDAAQQLVGIQAQVPKPPFLGLWSRVAGLQRGDVVQALLDKRLVRGTSMRGTLHVMTAADFTRFRAPLQAALDRGLKVLGDRTAAMEMEPVVALARAFFRKPQTFDAFRDHLAATFPKGDIRAMAYAARMQVPLLQVPTGGPWGFPAQAGFITAEAWLGRPPRSAGTLEELVLRYLAAYGPATAVDAQAWSGIPALKPVFEALRPQLVAFRGERGGELFDLPDAPRPDPDVPAPVRLLPDWDNAIVGRADARLLLAEHRSSVFQPGLRVLPTVLVDGVVAGTWKTERRRAAASLTVSLFGTQPARVRREIEAEGDSLLRFSEPDADTREVKVS